MNLLNVSWKNIWSNPLSTILSLILIAFGVGLLSLLILFQDQFSKQFEKNQAGIGMVVGAKGSPLQLILNSMFHVDAPTGNIDVEDATFLFNDKNPFIKQAVPLSVGDSYKSFRIIGTNRNILNLYSDKLQSGTLWESDMEAESIWAVHEGHDHGEDTHAGHDHDHDSPASLDTTNSVKQYTSKELSFLNHPEKAITSVLVQFNEDKKRAIPVINMPRNITENTPLLATPPTYELNKFLANVGSLLKAVSYLAILIAIISAFSIFISLYNKLRSRKHELAMMRVAGGKPSQLFSLILLEAIIIGIIGSIIGLVLAHFSMMFISSLLNNQFHYGLDAWKLHPMEAGLFCLTILISIIAGIIPAIKAYRTDIVKNLG